MISKTAGIVLKSLRFRESSVIVDVLTRELGMRSYIISGVYRKNSRSSPAHFHPMSLLELVVYEKDHKDLQRIKEYKLQKVLQSIPYNMIKGTTALFMAEVVRNCLRERNPHSELFDMLEEFVMQLEQADTTRLAVFPQLFLIALADKLGFGPQWNTDEGCEFFDLRDGVFCQYPPLHPDFMDTEESRSFFQLLDKNRDAEVQPVKRHMRKLLLEKLIIYFRLHIENFQNLRSVEVLSKVLHD